MACINILQQGSLQPRNQRWSKTANTVSHWKRAKGLFFFFFFPSTRIRMEVLVYRDYGEQEACSATSLPFRFLQRLIFLLSVELLVCNCMWRCLHGQNPDAVLLGKLPRVKKGERQPRIRQELDKSRAQQKHFNLCQHFQPTLQGMTLQQGPRLEV